MKNPHAIVLLNTSWQFQVQSHSRPWEAALLLVSTKNHDLWESPIFGACAKNSFCILSQSDCQSWIWACAELLKVRERGLPVLDLPRDRDSWSWPEEAQLLRTRVVQSLHIENGRTTWLIRNPRFLISIRISSLINSKVSIFLLFSTYIA